MARKPVGFRPLEGMVVHCRSCKQTLVCEGLAAVNRELLAHFFEWWSKCRGFDVTQRGDVVLSWDG